MTTPIEPKITVADCALPACAAVVSDRVPVDLVIQPDPGIVNVGGEWAFKAIVKFSDNSTNDVTTLSSWDSSSLTVASVAAGIATGAGIGTATVTATYGGLQAFGQITVVAVCIDTGTEITLCLARDRGMTIIDDGALSRMDLVRSGVTQLISILRNTDRLAIVSYAGQKIISGGSAEYSSEATTESPLTADKDALTNALANYAVRGPCNPSPVLSVCEIGIGGGLQQALSEANAGHVSGQRQIIVLVVDGRDAVNVPTLSDVGNVIKDADILLMVVGIAVPSDYNATLSALASPGLYFQSSASACAGIIARVPNMFCYYGTPEVVVPYSGPSRVRIAGYTDAMFRVCRFAIAKINGSTTWDGTLVYNRNEAVIEDAGTGLFYSDNVGSVKTLSPRLQADPSKHSIHGKALLMAQLSHYTFGTWGLDIFSINDSGETVRLWVGQRHGDENTPQGVYRLANSGGDMANNCYPGTLATVTIETF